MKSTRQATIHEKLAKALGESGGHDNRIYTADEISGFYIQLHGDREVKNRSMQASDHCDKLTDGSASGPSRCRVCESGKHLLIRVRNDGKFQIRGIQEIVANSTVPLIVANSIESQTAQIEDLAGDYEEGKRQLRHHLVLERNRKLVADKKLKFQRDHGRLYCEICDFDFAKFYGSVGEGYAECHHTTPLGQTEGVRMSRIENLVVVCANCHRMLHRPPFYPVDKLRAEVDLRITK